MKLNENIALATSKVLLVPYDRRHVPRYHEWMKDPEIQEATASEPLSLAEEYDNQASWRASHDKLTFILCQPPAPTPTSTTPISAISAGDADTPERMVGDINFFLYPSDADEDKDCEAAVVVVGEVDIMIAAADDRRKGVGRAAAAAFLHFVCLHREGILGEYDRGAGRGEKKGAVELRMLMAKIKAGNVGSIALFRRLGFVQEGGVNYFGEVKMVLRDLSELEKELVGYRMVEYRRPLE